MKIWESGRESHLLDEIIAGRKTIEGRLCRDKFAKYQPGDQVLLRRDYRDENGQLQNGLTEVLVEVVAIRKYDDFHTMCTKEGYASVMPSVKNAREAADSYDLYYTHEEQARFGVLAIEFKVISSTL